MKKFTPKLIFLIFLICWSIQLHAADKTVESVTIMQVDTFAFKGERDQLVIKVNIRVTGTANSLNLSRFVVNTANEDNTDVDSVGLYCTRYFNWFSKYDNPGDYFLMGKKQAIVGDSVAFVFDSYSLETGDNIFWIAMDLDKFSRPAHYLDAYIKKEGITIGGNSYPSVESKPAGVVGIVDIYYRDNFERMTPQKEPIGWTQQQLDGSPARWLCNIGGYTISTTGNPDKAKSGKYNVLLARQSYTPYKTILVSPKLDLSLSTRPRVSFYHAMAGWEVDFIKYIDELRVLYKIGSSGTWQELRKYELEAENWTKREILLPEGISYSNIYLGFEGTTKYGWGVCVDSLIIYETGIVPREIKEIIAENTVQDMVPQGSTYNPILKVNFRVKGTTGPITLNSFKITSANTSDADIKPSGIKLFVTNEDAFISPTQCGTAQSFAGGVATFSGLNKALETGNNYFWITYDISDAAYPGNKLDAKININDISLSNGNYPSEVMDPAGERIVQQTFFFEDFNLPTAWQLSGEFQVGIPTGKGGLTRGRPDPTYAYSGTTVLGTDLTGMGALSGDYESNIPASNPYTAISPEIDASYFKNISLQFYRYLNIDNTDTAAIEYKLEGSSDWVPIWASSTKFIEMDWSKQAFWNLSDLRRKKFQLRFKLGPTDAIDNYSGWNVDYLFMIGDSIPFDASIDQFISPQSSCSLTSNEKVKVRITNTGPRTLVNFPILLSLDGGKTYIQENVGTPILKNASIDYEFTTPIDMSDPKIYNFIVKAAHPGDNYPENDSIVQSVVSYPTYDLPYMSDFEKDTTFWFSGGINNSWSEGMPGSGIINLNSSGVNYWKTHGTNGYHNLNEESYVKSPCISFTGRELPMIDMDFNYITKPQMDGVIMEYSLDQGNTWKYVKQNTSTFSWTWYNDTVKTLEHRGWSGATAGNKWVEGRQFLPTDIIGNGKVQFRFVFKSDVTTLGPEEGFAFDNIKFYEAPYDIGVDTIRGIGPIACQYQNSPYLNVDVTNYGNRSMRTNDIIVVGAEVNGVIQAVDTFKLTSNLAAGATRNFTFTKPVNFEAQGSYIIKAYTMNGAEPSFYTTDNDTASIGFTVNPNPLTGLPDRIATAEPDTVKLKLVKNLGYSYLWDNGSTDTSRVCTDGADKYYKATVTDKVTGCKTKDSTFIELLVSDISPIALLKPTDNCGYGALIKPIVRIKNTGTDTLRVNKSIPIKYSLDGNPEVTDVVPLPAKLAPDSTVDLELLTTMDLAAIKTYSLDLYTDLYNDNIPGNDVLPTTTFTIFGYPTVNIGDPTIVERDTMYKFTATPGFVSYTWSNDSVTNTNTVKTSGLYKLTVTDNNGCPAEASSYVFLKVRDVKPHLLVSPVTTCNNDALSDVILRIKNNGTDTIATTDNLTVSYQLNGGATVTEVLTPTSQIIPGDSVDFNFATQVDLKTKGAYTFKMWLESSPEPDIIKENDTATFVVNVNGLPNPSIGIDMSIQALEYTIDPGVGFVSYLWQDGSTDSTYVVTQDHHSPDQRYQVTVTDINGCQNTTPKIFKILVVPDVSVNRILLAEKACALTNQELIKVEIKNTGNSTVDKEKTIRLKYQVNGGGFSKIDTLKLSSIFIENQVLTHTFKQLADLSALGTKAVKVFVEYADDVRLINDTLTTFIEIFDMPVVNLSATGTIVADLPYTLDPGAGFQSYLWSTGATDQTLEVVSAGTYAVSVTNSFCLGVDTVQVIEKTFDLGISDIGIPGQACFLTNNETVSVTVVNSGTETLTNEPITLRYILNGTIDKSENFEFSGNTGLTQTFNFADKIDLSGINIYTLEVMLTYANDEVADNNLLSKNISVTGAPAIVFAEEVNDTIRTTIFPHILDAGLFVSYKWQDETDNRVFSAPSEGWYKVAVVNTGGCVGSDSVFIRNITAIRILDDKVKISIYPNPVNDYLYVDMNLEAPEDIVLEVVSASGQVISNKKLSGSLQYNEIVEALRLAKGLYYIRVQGKDWVITEKVIIQ